MAIKARHTIITVAGLSLILASVSPFLFGFYSTVKSINDAKHQVRQLDHVSIRDAARVFIAEKNDKSNRMLIDREIPAQIRQTDPKFVHFADGVLYIEYGGGFAHYGLAIPMDGVDYRAGNLLADGIFFYEAE